jgi:hypothetical protein
MLNVGWRRAGNETTFFPLPLNAIRLADPESCRFKLVDYLWKIREQVIWPEESQNISVRNQTIRPTLAILFEFFGYLEVRNWMPKSFAVECSGNLASSWPRF